MKTTSRIALALLIGWVIGPLGRAQQPKETRSVSPGINDTWKSPEIEPLIDRLEGESREIYAHRKALAALAGPPPGAAVADIGSGSGFMLLELAGLVGPQGKVYGVDINPEMLKFVAEKARKGGLSNVETILGADRSAHLPKGALDLVFICDTYHHFEFPRSMMASIHQALKAGGQVVVVDFDRIPGQSPSWILKHVRASRETVIEEIESAGFRLVNVHGVDFLQDNYVIRFQKIE